MPANNRLPTPEEIQERIRNGQMPSDEQIGEFIRNRQNFPLEELMKYAGMHIAYSLDGKRIVASGKTEEELEEQMRVAGLKHGWVVESYVDPLE